MDYISKTKEIIFLAKNICILQSIYLEDRSQRTALCDRKVTPAEKVQLSTFTEYATQIPRNWNFYFEMRTLKGRVYLMKISEFV
jgi:hypothetical protein